jgi:hypothetical protein
LNVPKNSYEKFVKASTQSLVFSPRSNATSMSETPSERRRQRVTTDAEYELLRREVVRLREGLNEIATEAEQDAKENPYAGFGWYAKKAREVLAGVSE